MVHVTLAAPRILRWLLDSRIFVHPCFRLRPSSKYYEQQKLRKFGLLPPSSEDKTKENLPCFVCSSVTNYQNWDHEASKL